jgi:hypothetical protein
MLNDLHRHECFAYHDIRSISQPASFNDCAIKFPHEPDISSRYSNVQPIPYPVRFDYPLGHAYSCHGLS